MAAKYILATAGAAWLCAGLAAAQASGWATNQVNSTMCQWALPRGAVIRDTAYLDGGKLWFAPGLNDGSYGGLTEDGNPLGLVYQLNFSTPFNMSQNISQILTTISKAPGGGAANNFAPNYYDGAMLANDGEYFTYGGLLTRTGSSFPDPAADDVGLYQAYWYGGEGKLFRPGFVKASLPSGIITRYEAYGAAVSVPSENKGYYFSGTRAANFGPVYFADNETDNADVITNSLISVDMSVQQSEVWTNKTLPASIPGRAGAELVWIPLGEQGTLIAIGGVVDPIFATLFQSLNSTQLADSQTNSPNFVSSVAIYDIANDVWYEQPTSSGPGHALTQGCTVVASAPDGSSHNIYWYGGFDGLQNKQYYDDVWILSVPSFTWIQAASGTDAHARSGHRCFKPYPDQMLVIGGTPDPVTPPKCLGGGLIQNFNLSSLQWVNRYDPAVWSEYAVPQLVYSVVGGNAQGGATKSSPASWSNSKLSTLFGTAYDSSKIKKWYPYASTAPVNTTRPDVPSQDNNNGGSGVPTWLAPVLGVVLGLVFLSAIFVAVLLWRRRRYLKRAGDDSLTGTSDANRHRILSWVRGNDGKAATVTSEDPSSTDFGDEGHGVAGANGARWSGNTVGSGTGVGVGGYGQQQQMVQITEAGGTMIHEMPDTSQIQELSATTGLSFAHPPHFPSHSQPPSTAPSSATSPLQHNPHLSTASTSAPSRASTVSRTSGTPAQGIASGELSPLASPTTPRPDSPSLGLAGAGGAGVGSGGDGERGHGTGKGGGGAGKAESPFSPVSPPTPAQGAQGGYLSAGAASAAKVQGQGQTQRKSVFGELLDES